MHPFKNQSIDIVITDCAAWSSHNVMVTAFHAPVYIGIYLHKYIEDAWCITQYPEGVVPLGHSNCLSGQPFTAKNLGFIMVFGGKHQGQASFYLYDLLPKEGRFHGDRVRTIVSPVARS